MDGCFGGLADARSECLGCLHCYPPTFGPDSDTPSTHELAATLPIPFYRHHTFEKTSANPIKPFASHEHVLRPKPQPTVITPHLVRTAARKQHSTHYGRIRFKAAVFDLGEEGDPNPDSGTCKR
jgi:hypothetical protein